MSEVKIPSNIFFCGIKNQKKLHYLVFEVHNFHTDKYRSVEIPVPQYISDLIMTHLQRFVAVEHKPVERGNDEESL